MTHPAWPYLTAPSPKGLSVVGQGREITLGFPVPAHPRHGMLPPVLHLFQRTFVRLIARGDRFVQMLVLGLYDLVGGVAVKFELTRSAQLLAGHGRHEPCPLR